MDELKVQPRMRAEAQFQDVFPRSSFPRMHIKAVSMRLRLEDVGYILSK